jgi:hypothetical protein
MRSSAYQALSKQYSAEPRGNDVVPNEATIGVLVPVLGSQQEL